MTKAITLCLPLCCLPFIACVPGPTPGEGEGEAIEVPADYSFDSRFVAGESSVSYSGQVFRHALLDELDTFIANLNEPRYSDETGAETLVADLNFFYDYSNLGGTGDDALNITLAGGETVKQSTLGEIASAKSLRDKMPELDADFTGGVVGYGAGDLEPDAVVQDLFARLGAHVQGRALNGPANDPLGVQIADPWVTPEGVDLRQLTDKFLTGAVAYSQGCDDYLDDATENKGLLSDNTVPAEGKPYSQLEHAWDEGWGYFGGARDMGAYTDDEIAGKGGRSGFANGYHDTDPDGEIDLLSEINRGHALNAAKRDRGAGLGDAATDFTADAFDAFRAGRTLIHNADGSLDDETMSALVEQRDIILLAWEQAIVATVVHYINNVLADMGAFGSEGYSFAAHAKDWSELKGFALILQFNPHTRFEDGDIAALHTLIGDAPVLPGAEAATISSYVQDLEATKTIIQASFGFHDDNMAGW